MNDLFELPRDLPFPRPQLVALTDRVEEVRRRAARLRAEFVAAVEERNGAIAERRREFYANRPRLRPR